MIERHLDIPSADGAMPCFVVHPEEHGPHPVVLFYMDAPGKREELHDFARRLASAGYLVVLPNLYYRQRREYFLKERTEAQMAEMFGLMRSLDRATTECDTRALLAWVDREPAADGGRVAALGYCMSGPFVVWAACAFPDRIRAIAAIHGANWVTEAPDSPHRAVRALRCEGYFACAEIDQWAPPEHVALLEEGLKASGAPYRVEWYPGVQHGFSFPQRAVYDRAAAERHWERMHRLFARTLQPVR
ncbi:MAG: dienelactone hydrolase family protein [Rubrivivax sp.]